MPEDKTDARPDDSLARSEDGNGGQAAEAERHQQERAQLPGHHERVAEHGGDPAVAGLVCPDDGAHLPEAGDGRLPRLAFGHPDREARGGGLAQVIFRLGQDDLGLVRRGAQARAELVQVLLDRVAGRHVVPCSAHAGHPGRARTRPAAGRQVTWADQPSTACTPPANFRHSVCWAARAATPLSVSP